MRIGKALKLYRVTAGMTDREFGAEIGVSAATVSRIENGFACDMRSFAKLIAWLVTDEIETSGSDTKFVALQNWARRL